jgi:hypothetical protein
MATPQSGWPQYVTFRRVPSCATCSISILKVSKRPAGTSIVSRASTFPFSSTHCGAFPGTKRMDRVYHLRPTWYSPAGIHC